MYTHGEIAKVHPNGRISYVGNETRADGVPLTETASNSNEGDKERDESEDDEEEIVLGKGFDYKSDSDSGEDFDEQKDDYDEIMGTHDPEEQADQRPDSFSRIAVETLGDQAAIKERFPLFSNCRECIVELKEGQTLYVRVCLQQPPWHSSFSHALYLYQLSTLRLVPRSNFGK
jgi:hypothetical protein